jgi:hypothetical protein
MPHACRIDHEILVWLSRSAGFQLTRLECLTYERTQTVRTIRGIAPRFHIENIYP